MVKKYETISCLDDRSDSDSKDSAEMNTENNRSNLDNIAKVDSASNMHCSSYRPNPPIQFGEVTLATYKQHYQNTI